MENSELDKILIIADVGQAHDGSLGIAHSYIDLLADLDVDIVKFQTHIAIAESSKQEPFRVQFSYEDQTRFDYWRRMQFTREQWLELKTHCEEKNLEFLSSPFSNAAVDLLESIEVTRYKIGSGEVSNDLMIEKVAKTGKPIIISSGMSSYEELDKTIAFLGKFPNPVTLMQCTSSYPTKPSQWGLNLIQELKQRYGLPIGFSDHSGNIYAGLAAAALGATTIEFHVVFDHHMFGPDSKASLTPAQIQLMVSGIRQIESSLKNPIEKNKSLASPEMKSIFEKSLAINKDLSKGALINIEDLEAKKPSNFGIPPEKFRDVIGQRLNKDKKAWDFLNYSDLA